jgi:phosphopantetheinyl transferase
LKLQVLSRNEIQHLSDGVLIGIVLLDTLPSNIEYLNQEGFSAVTLNILTELFAQKGIDSDLIGFSKQSGGKPTAIVRGKPCGISISHSKEFLVCAINLSGEVGVDLERCDRIVHNRLFIRMQHPAEDFAHSVDPIRVWTMKEAVLKLTGTGLRTNMNTVNLHQINEELFSTEHQNYDIRVSSTEYKLHWLSIATTHA